MGRRLAILSGLGFALLLTACERGTQEQRAQWEADAARPVVCADAADCEVKWGRALEWVRDNAPYRIKSATRYAIVTSGPGQSSTLSALTITRIAKPDGTGQILFDAVCGNIFGCDPPQVLLRARFNNFVMR